MLLVLLLLVLFSRAVSSFDLPDPVDISLSNKFIPNTEIFWGGVFESFGNSIIILRNRTLIIYGADRVLRSQINLEGLVLKTQEIRTVIGGQKILVGAGNETHIFDTQGFLVRDVLGKPICIQNDKFVTTNGTHISVFENISNVGVGVGVLIESNARTCGFSSAGELCLANRTMFSILRKSGDFQHLELGQETDSLISLGNLIFATNGVSFDIINIERTPKIEGSYKDQGQSCDGKAVIVNGETLVTSCPGNVLFFQGNFTQPFFSISNPATNFGKSIGTLGNLNLLIGGDKDIHTFRFPECTSSGRCGNGEICRVDRKCTKIPCENSFGCNREMLNGRLGSCENGYCVDKFEGTCSSKRSCDSANNIAFASQNALGEVPLEIDLDGITFSQEILRIIIDEIEENFENRRIRSKLLKKVVTRVNTSNSVFFDANVFIRYRNDDQLLRFIRDIVCGQTKCRVRMGKKRRGRRGRNLLIQDEIEVVMDFTTDSIGFETLSQNEAFDNPHFVHSLSNISGIDISPHDLKSYHTKSTAIFIIAAESDGLQPITAESLEDINYVAQNIKEIASNLEVKINVGRVDICAERNCNDRGTCDSATGICSCEAKWWGVNCETPVSCENQGIPNPDEAYCFCHFPFFGRRCENKVLCC